jgi:putative membrane protein
LREKLKISNKKATRSGFFVADPAFVKRRSPTEWLMFGSFGIYCFVFPWAMLLLSFDWMPFGMEWMSSLLLVVLGLACAGWLWTNYGRAGLLVSTGIFLAGLALEYEGVVTGFPFGAYQYTGVLVPALPGGLPLVIGFAWLLIITGSFCSAWWLLAPLRSDRAGRTRTIRLALVGAILAVGLDMLIEPVAYHVKGYWLWLAGGAYYGIPWSNFVTWLAASFAMILAMAALLRTGKRARWERLPVALFVMNAALFGVVNAAHGYWLPGVVTLLLCGAMGVRAARFLTDASARNNSE